jgi:hypothetical protein
MNEQVSALARRLNRLFWALTLPAVALLGIVFAAHRLGVWIDPPFGTLRGWGIVLLVLSVVFGVALPILIRTLFNKRAVERKRVEMIAFTDYQRRLVVISIAAAYIAGIAYLLAVPKLYLYGSVLAGLYGIYSAIPSERKLAGELRFYGLANK